MIIVRLQGRLVNQMFRYAFAKRLQAAGKTATIDSGMLNNPKFFIFTDDPEWARLEYNSSESQ